MGLDPGLLKQLTETFKTELEEQLQVIIDGLLELEKKRQGSKERATIIANIFRSAHNIKGSSRSLGINNVGDIAHHVESIFASLQKNMLEISSDMIDLCLEAVDMMRLSMQSFLDNKPLNFDIKKFLSRLDDALQGKYTKIKSDTSSSILAKTDIQKSIPQQRNIEDHVDEKVYSESKSYDSLRVAIENIDRISALMEEMQVNKIAIDDHYLELIKLINKAKNFSDTWKQVLSVIKNDMADGYGDNQQKLYYSASDGFTELNTIIQNLYKNMHGRINELSILSNALQDEIRMLRLVPAANLLGTFPRYIRDLSHELNKQVELKLVDNEVKMDKMVLESLKDPLMHLLRNCIDHGIESPEIRKSAGKPAIGRINIFIKEDSGQIHISIIDDGAGISLEEVSKIALEKKLVAKNDLDNMSDEEKLNLIFQHGFSTKEIITDVSGRGVGLDVVKANINNLNGHVSVKSELGKGTTFDLYVPLTLASERGLMIAGGDQMFFIPVNAVKKILSIEADKIFNIAGSQAIRLDQRTIPLYTLTDILELEQKDFPNQNQLSIIIVEKGLNTIAILVDEIIGEREIVIKPLQLPLANIPCVAGGTLSGSNQVIIVLNPKDLIDVALHKGKTRINFQQQTEKVVSRPHILVVDDSITTRSLEKNILESKNYQVTVAVNGKEAWDLLQKQKFSLIITDVMMPIMDGFALTERIKQSEKLHELPVIIVTSLGSNEEKKHGIEVGADAYIVKNEFESSILLEIVEQLV